MENIFSIQNFVQVSFFAIFRYITKLSYSRRNITEKEGASFSNRRRSSNTQALLFNCLFVQALLIVFVVRFSYFFIYFNLISTLQFFL